MLYISMYNSFHKSCRQKEEMYVFVNALLILFFFFFFQKKKRGIYVSCVQVVITEIDFCHK